MKIGYVRVGTQKQNTARQEVLMKELGVDEVYIDKMSGKSTDRPELKKMMQFVRQGDTVIVESISRFARNTRDLLELLVHPPELDAVAAQQKAGRFAAEAMKRLRMSPGTFYRKVREQ